MLKEETEPSCWNRSATLHDLGGDHDLLTEMIGLFLQQAPAYLTALRQALSRNDRTALAETAHAFKGMAGHFRAETLRQSAAVLEKSARHHDPELNRLTETLSENAQRLIAELKSQDDTS